MIKLVRWRLTNSKRFLLLAAEENPTIGIILCKGKNNAVVEMTLPEDNTQIFASKYETVLPSKEELQKLLEEQLAEEPNIL